MPKVSKYGFRLTTSDIAKYYEVDIMYSTDTLFYIDVPKDFLETFKLLSEDQLKECNAKTYLKKGHYGNQNRSGKISGITESECKINCDKLFKLLQENSVIKSPVIIITLETNGALDYRHSNSHYNTQHQKQKLVYALKYCTKVQLGDKITYNEYYTETWSGKNEITRREISVDSKNIVIPDTVENRLFLENTYELLFNLIDKMKNHFNNEDSVLELISSNQKLLS